MFATALLTASLLMSTPTTPHPAGVSTLPAQRLSLVGALGHPNIRQSVRNAQPAVIEVQVNAEGGVGHARVQSTSGSPDLDRSALLAVRRASLQGAEPGSRVRIPVKFQLNGDEVASR